MTQMKPTYRAHDNYISLNFGGGRTFTYARTGFSGTNIPDNIFTILHDEVNRVMRGFGWNQGQAMRHLCDNMDALWPEWDYVPSFEPGDPVRLADGRDATVIEKKRINYLVRFENGQEEMVPPVLMRKVGKPNAKRPGA
jgi:hypothetical protein